MKANCWARDKQPKKEANLVGKEKETTNLFMASSSSESASSSIWLVDNGCSNHMTGNRKLFMSFDES